MTPDSEPTRPKRPDFDLELTALRSLAAACIEELDEDRLFQRVTDIVCGTLPIDHFVIALYHEATGLLCDHPSSRRNCQTQPLFMHLGEGVMGTVAQTGKPMRIADVRLEPVYCQGSAETRSELVVPILIRDQLIGVINCESTELDAFTDQDQRFLLIVAGQLAPAVARLRILPAIQFQEEKYRAFFENSGSAMICLKGDGTISLCNKEFSKLSGWSREEVEERMNGLDLLGAMENKLPGAERGRIWLADPAGGPESYEFVFMARDGSRREVVATRSRMPGTRQTLVVLADITESKRMAAEAGNLRERLRLSEKFEAIGHLAGGVAHDFNNQLAAIMGLAEALEETCPGDIQKRFARNILRSCHRSADLTRKLLAFARKGRVLSEPVDLHAIILEVVGLLQHSLDKMITLRTRLEAERSVVMGDPTQLQNAFMNMAINARDAMPEGGTLTFETRVLALDQSYCRSMPYEITEGVYLEVRVVDSGLGMDGETLRHIFEPFFTTKALGKGTGLGLASVYGTVKQHNGHIDVRSTVGLGSCFNVFLPLTDRPVAASEPPPAEEPPRGKGHILFVDDEPVVAEVTREILATLKYQVTVCRDGLEGVAFYERAWRTVDLVLLDMVMPRMGGKEAFLAMRRINPDAKILLVSGFSVEGEAQQLLQAGARGFLQKPYRRVDLAKELSRILGDLAD